MGYRGQHRASRVAEVPSAALIGTGSVVVVVVMVGISLWAGGEAGRPVAITISEEGPPAGTDPEPSATTNGLGDMLAGAASELPVPLPTRSAPTAPAAVPPAPGPRHVPLPLAADRDSVQGVRQTWASPTRRHRARTTFPTARTPVSKTLRTPLVKVVAKPSPKVTPKVTPTPTPARTATPTRSTVTVEPTRVTPTDTPTTPKEPTREPATPSEPSTHPEPTQEPTSEREPTRHEEPSQAPTAERERTSDERTGPAESVDETSAD